MMNIDRQIAIQIYRQKAIQIDRRKDRLKKTIYTLAKNLELDRQRNVQNRQKNQKVDKQMKDRQIRRQIER